ncbi:MAG: TspO protein [Candidatus Yonathbacteria bacterium RBG_16_43_6]|uniref:TspO protein n=2 Tax=Parcubacteria group TaxID=1794811 RepID=A0A1G2SD26_9BACT|nr:MAG: Benzodiazepine receptor TspO [Candidatus Azambacteria bacterium GW2011_GWA1_44_9]OHA78837.1 MAG: TspO protein [Candidatus Yonathbacteria bacterium RIFCSPHIGHO2_01_FULL_44_19]OHA80249.1 MAG: TspO protein [Candidatus Yonathbacteria bacterium RBG_16_43_6]OHA82915.1 MAG: TspO protein [Candidatus Yonathbacteria bacterium RIFCSPLOWO2_01_FULL_43_27]
MHIHNFLKLLITVTLSLLAGAIGSLFTVSAIQEWYPMLIKPALNPPSWIFAPVWTTLYVMMGVAAFLVWKRGGELKNVTLPLSLFVIQLVLNALWSIIFFGMHNPKLAFFEILLLWVAILATIISFMKISKRAGWLLVPYLLWVSFASYLTFSIWMLN